VKEVICPACRRVRDRFPAGWLRLEGAFLAAHRDDVFAVLRAEEQLEREEHPLHRIIDIEDTAEGVTITTTDVHLPRRIADAIRRAYEGQVTGGYRPGDEVIELTWRRDDPHMPAAREPQPPLPVEIQANGLIVTPEADAYLKERIERLRRFHPRIVSVRVVLEAPATHHQKGGPYRINIHVELPGPDAHVTRQESGDLHVALRNAFDAMQRQLEDAIRRMRGDVSPTVQPPRGRVVRLFPDRGYGFLEAEDGHEVYFQASSVLDDAFGQLSVGSVVRYHEEMGENGPQASSVAIG
jgi:ribosomal subunit interface protein